MSSVPTSFKGRRSLLPTSRSWSGVRWCEHRRVGWRSYGWQSTTGSEQGRAFDDVCAAAYGHLVGTVSFLLADRWQAEDVAQEVLARTWLRWQRVSSLERPDLWTQRVAVNLARTAWRRRPWPPRGNEPPSPCASSPTLPWPTPAALMHCQQGTVKALTSQGIERLRAAMDADREGRRD